MDKAQLLHNAVLQGLAGQLRSLFRLIATKIASPDIFYLMSARREVTVISKLYSQDWNSEYEGQRTIRRYSLYCPQHALGERPFVVHPLRFASEAGPFCEGQ